MSLNVVQGNWVVFKNIKHCILTNMWGQNCCETMDFNLEGGIPLSELV